MNTAIEIFTVMAICAGAAFFMAGSVGLLRFPDSLTRLHALTKADNLGLGLIVVGLLPQADSLLGGLKWRSGCSCSSPAPPSRSSLLRPCGAEVGEHERVPALDIGLAVLVLAVAIWTIVSRDAFAAVVGYVAYGLLVSLVRVRLFAVDVALTEAAIGSGVTGVLLISAAVRLRGTEAAVAAEWPGAGSRLLAAALCIVVSAALAAVVLIMPDPGATLAPEAARHHAATELGNPVTAVLMAFRALDTLLEKVVLFLAVIGVWSLAADGNWGGIAGPLRATHRRGALAFLAQLLPPVGIVVAIHIVWVGANKPGDAFQGGAILAAMWLIVIMARLAEAPAIGGRRLRLALVAGPVVFLAVGLLGLP